jgi:hypothetical protein
MGRTYQSILVNAPADEVWAAIRGFYDFAWAPNVITKVVVVGDKTGEEVGAVRLLNDAFTETLVELNDDDHSFRYSIGDAPAPASKAEMSNYVARASVRPVTEGGGTFVEWASAWEGDDPATSEFLHGVYVALLNDLKKSMEQ